MDLRKNYAVLNAAQQDHAARSFKTGIASAIGLSGSGGLLFIKEHVDSDTVWTHKRYQQTFMGISFWGENVRGTEASAGSVSMMHGNAIVGIDQDISSVKAVFSARRFFFITPLHS